MKGWIRLVSVIFGPPIVCVICYSVGPFFVRILKDGRDCGDLVVLLDAPLLSWESIVLTLIGPACLGAIVICMLVALWLVLGLVTWLCDVVESLTKYVAAGFEEDRAKRVVSIERSGRIEKEGGAVSVASTEAGAVSLPGVDK